MALLPGPQPPEMSWDFGCHRKKIFIFISTSSAFPFLFLSWPVSYLWLGDNCNTNHSTPQTVAEVGDVHWCFSLFGEEKEKRRMEKETCLV